MKRDTKRLEELLANTQANHKMVREEILAGTNLEHIRHQLIEHEQVFAARLKDLREWNSENAPAAKAAASQT